jgi:hypothetical protein
MSLPCRISSHRIFGMYEYVIEYVDWCAYGYVPGVAQGKSELNRIFWLQRPDIYFNLVDRTIMVFSFYLALWITNFNGMILLQMVCICVRCCMVV